MRKRGCGMISYEFNGEDNLLLIGGIGPKPLTEPAHSLYVPDPNYSSHRYTDEIHVMHLSSSPGIT